MWTPTKTTDSRATLECRSAVRKRGQDGRCQRTTLTRPRQVTKVSRISETMPAPRAANQSSWSFMPLPPGALRPLRMHPRASR